MVKRRVLKVMELQGREEMKVEVRMLLGRGEGGGAGGLEEDGGLFFRWNKSPTFVHWLLL